MTSVLATGLGDLGHVGDLRLQQCDWAGDPHARFAEGHGVKWGAQLLVDLLGRWDKRGGPNIRNLDPGRLDSARFGELLARYGGEEFVVVLPGADLPIAEKVGERIRKAIAAKPFLLGPGSHLTVTASLGVSSLASAQDTVEDLLKRADRALYRAKREGRNRVVPAAA